MDGNDPCRQAERLRMVREQLEAPHRGITDPRVLDVMRRVPRHCFVPDALQHEAYADHPLPIGGGQTISQPFIVALMCQMLDIRPGHRVLEIGTGCGYQAAVLAGLTDEVFSIECVADLAEAAARRLQRLGVHVHLRHGDGWDGWPEHAPFDRIIISCAPDRVPEPLLGQLADPGVMVLPVGAAHALQHLCRVGKRGGAVDVESFDAVRFVPMVGG